MNDKTNVLLVGASTEIGRYVLKQLLARKDKFNITVFDVKKSRSQTLLEPLRDDITVVYGNIALPADTVEVVKGQDFVIHCGFLSPRTACKKYPLAEEVNALGTRFLIENLEHYSPQAYLVMLSSIEVYGDRLTAPMLRTSDFLAPSIGNFSALTRIQAEKFVQDSSLEWTIFRPSIVMGTEMEEMDGEIFLMPLESHLEFVHAEDLAFALVESYQHRPSLWNKVFNVGGGTTCRAVYSEFLSRLFSTIGWGEMDFPERTFATYNRYGGYFSDGDALEEILHFRKYSIDDYFSELANAKTLAGKLATKLFSGLQKKNLLAKSEPYKAFRQNDSTKMKYYF